MSQATKPSSPNKETTPSARMEMLAGETWSAGIPLLPGSTIDVYEWGLETNTGTIPSGLECALVDDRGNVVDSESTNHTDGNPIITSWTNSRSKNGTAWVHLRVENGSSVDIMSGRPGPNWVEACFVVSVYRQRGGPIAGRY